MAELHDLVAHWFKERRGIRRETVDAFGIYTEGNDIVIPYPGGLKKRRYSEDKENNPFGLDKEGRRFSWEDVNGNSTGAGQVPFLPPDFEPREWIILIPEGETDTMATWQAMPDDVREKVAVVGLSGVGSFRSAVLGIDKNGNRIGPDRTEELFGNAKKVFVPLDNDDPYENPDGNDTVERSWAIIRKALGKRARRVRLPQGQKDLAEFFMAYNWAAFRELLVEAARPRYHYQPLDLTKPVPETDWLVKELFEMGVLTVIAAEPGAGKSFLTQGLTIELLAGATHFLGQEIMQSDARVLYVDEENNEVLVRQRLAALGFTKDMQERLHYLSRQGVNLNRNPDWLLEDAIEFEPTLCVIDSQRAVSVGVKENSNDEITEFYRRAVIPIPMQTGAATVVLHHTPHDGNRAAGAVAIMGSADQVLTLSPHESGNTTSLNRFSIFPSKPRRLGTHLTGEIVGEMETDGWVRVQALGGEAM